MKRLPILITSALIFSSFVFAQPEHRPEKMEGAVHRAARQDDRSGADAIRRMRHPARKIALRTLTASDVPVSRKSGLVPTGINRQLPEDAAARGEWGTSPEGKRVWRLAIESGGAQAVRVKFTGFHVGAGNVWVLASSQDGTAGTVGPYAGDGLFGDGEFWSDIVSGDSLVVVYEPAAGDTSDTVPFTPVELSHRFRKAAAKAGDDSRQAAAASCAVDVTCHPEFSEPASAVALMIFESGGESYDCTGALIGSASQPALPFFATANHCIGTAAEAKSLIAVFNYQTSVCDGTPPSLSRLPRVNGATLLSTQPMSEGDFSLLQLSSFPSVDVKVLGWTAETIAGNERVAGISHPLGDYKRIALGRRTRDLTIRFSDGERMPASVGYQVAWFEGVTQGGSSGSPLLVEIDGKQYLAGTLTAGPDVDEDSSRQVCRTSNLVASYGRFSAVYPALTGYLTSKDGGGRTSDPVISQPAFTASPGILTLAPGQTTGTVTLSWTAPSDVRYVQVRVGSATGPAMTGFEGPVGSAQTGEWVTNGMTFFLQDASDGNSRGFSRTIATVRIQARTAAEARDADAPPSADAAQPGNDQILPSAW